MVATIPGMHYVLRTEAGLVCLRTVTQQSKVLDHPSHLRCMLCPVQEVLLSQALAYFHIAQVIWMERISQLRIHIPRQL